MSITINLATRGRPERMLATAEQTLSNIRLPDTRLVVSIDEDDEPSLCAAAKLPSDVTVSIKPREDSLGAKWNRVLDYPADLYTYTSDYVPFDTRGFDIKMSEAVKLFPDGIGVVYSRMANLSFPAIQGVTHGLAIQLGWMYPPYFPYWFVDHWLDDIVRMIDRIVHADIRVHVMPKLPTQEMREPGFWATFYDAMKLMRRRQAVAIIDSPEFHESSWRRDVLKRNFPLHEYRSQWINDQVRALKLDSEPKPTDRYLRLRRQALEMIAQEMPGLREWAEQ